MSKQEGNADASGRDDSSPAKKDNADIYESRGTKKIVRLVTVMAYMFSVSFVAIVLSAYYLFLWEPPNPRLIHRAHHLRAEPRIEFLLAEAPRPLGQSAPRPHGVSGSPLLQNLDGELTAKEPGGQIAGEFFAADFKDQERLDDALLRLRSSLMERFWRRSGNTLNSKEDPSEGEKPDAGKLAEAERTPVTLPAGKFGSALGIRAEASSETSKPGDDNATALIPESSISGEEAAKGGSLGRESFLKERSEESLHRGSQGEPEVGRELSSAADRGNGTGAIGTRGGKTNDSIVANIYESPAAAASTGSFRERSINTASTMAKSDESLVNGSLVKDEGADPGSPGSKGLSSAGGSRGDGTPVQDPGNSFQVEATRPAGLPRGTAPASVRATNLAINSEDTQAERIAMTAGMAQDGQLSRPEATTQRQKGLLAILTQIATAEVPSSNSTAPTASEDLFTDSTPIAGSTESGV